MQKTECVQYHKQNIDYVLAGFLRSRGVGEDASWMLGGSGKGWWRLSKTPQLHRAMGHDWFSEIGLYSLSDHYARLST